MSNTGIIFDIKKYAIHDGPGIRTTVFFKGCSMGCLWCHNPESKHFGVESFTTQDRVKKISKTETVGYEITVNDLLEIIMKDRVFYEESGGGVTFSGGEPTLQPEFLLEILKACKAVDLHTVLDTCGEASWKIFDQVLDFVDLFLFDLKLIDNIEHNNYTGVGNKRIHKNLINLIAHDKVIELRVPLIPDITDSEKNIDEIVKFISDLEKKPSVTLLPYNSLNLDKLERFCLQNKLIKLKPQSQKKLFSIKQKFIVKNIDANIGD